MINFTVGPVQMNEEIKKIGSLQIPYFRTEEFSNLMYENEKMIKKFTNARIDDKVVFITGSGTASMEASIINCLNENDKILIINGGTFGKRFVEICGNYDLNYTEIKLEYGHTLKKTELYKYANRGYTALLVNHHETSTGVLYDLDMISEFCDQNNLFLIVDAISSFISDPIDIKNSKIDILITGSQKALACPPGISIMILSKKAIDKINNNNPKTYYFNLKYYFDNMERGQTPFTPAVGTLIQVNKKLKMIDEEGGVAIEREKISNNAKYFRSKIVSFPFKIFSNSPSNAVTSLLVESGNAYDIFLTLKDKYNIWVCPNSGALKEKVFRVGHIGNLNYNDYDVLIDSLKSYYNIR